MGQLCRLFWLLVIAVHGAGAAVWLWLMPGGFPLTHPKFAANRLLPALVMLWVGLAGVGLSRR